MMKFVDDCAIIICIIRTIERVMDMNNTIKIMKFLSLPMALIATAYILFLNISRLPMSSTLMLQYLSYVFFIIGMLLGLRFNKSKVFFLCLLLGISQMLLSKDLFTLPFIQSKLPYITDFLSLLIPVNILLFSLFKERGIFTIWGKIKFGFIFIQILLIWLLISPPDDGLRTLINYRLIDFDFIDIISIPQISSLLFLLILLALCTKLYYNPTLAESSLIGVVIVTFIGLNLKDNFIGLNIFFATAGLILVLSVVETSYSMAYRDELTGIPARRALKESMMKLGSKYTIAMIDIDFFKKFNDTYGHDTGDDVLQMVASNLALIGGGGKAFRFGGEEFTILFANKTREEVIPQLEELRKIISKQKHAYNKNRKVNGKDTVVTKMLSVTISIGVAEKSEKYKTADEVLKAADKALYRAKKNGRNCVCK
jgi:diguanylate cyclase (GGDEF)-like protein